MKDFFLEVFQMFLSYGMGHFLTCIWIYSKKSLVELEKLDYTFLYRLLLV